MTFSEVLCHYLAGGLSTPEYKRGRQVCHRQLLSTTAVARSDTHYLLGLAEMVLTIRLGFDG
jgi:hypothetical protein